ncbi:MAG TPA: hypothetical protein VGL40_13375 [Bacillota bacterium]
MRWSVHLARQYPRRSLWTAVGIAATAVLFLVGGLGAWWAVVAVVIITASISAWVFPISYELTTRRVKMGNLLFREDKSWLRFNDYAVHPDSVQLLFDQRSLRGRVLKGLLLYFGPENRGEVLRIVRENVVTAEQLAELIEEEDD